MQRKEADYKQRMIEQEEQAKQTHELQQMEMQRKEASYQKRIEE